MNQNKTKKKRSSFYIVVSFKKKMIQGAFHTRKKAKEFIELTKNSKERFLIIKK